MGSTLSFFRMIKLIITILVPQIAKAFGIRFMDDVQNQFYRSLVQDTMKHRATHGIVRNDMIHLLIEAKKGSLKLENDTGFKETEGFATVDETSNAQLNANSSIKWDDDDFTAQCFLFFVAGFETSSTLLCFASQELTENQDVQQKLIAEIDEVREQLDGKPLTYEILQKMKYMDMVVSGK